MADPTPSRTSPRPAQVTYAGWAVILGSLALVVSSFQQVATLHTLDTRTAVERLITSEPGGLGFTVEDWLRVLKVIGMACGACAAAGAILGWQTLQRSRPARVVLLVLAVPLVVTGLATGPVFAILVAIAVVALWLPAANAWFDPDRRRSAPTLDAAADDVPPPPAPPSAPYGQQPPPYAGPYGGPHGGSYGGSYGSSPAGQPAAPAYPPLPYGAPQPPPGPYRAPVDPEERPGAVTAAAVITFVLAGLSVLLGLIAAVVGATAAQAMMDELDRSGYDTGGFTAHELAVGFAVLGCIMALAGIAAIVAAALVLRRSHAARIVLTVLSGITIALSVVAITAVVSVITLAGAIATIVLLFRPASNAWFAGRAPRPPYPPVASGGSWPAG